MIVIEIGNAGLGRLRLSPSPAFELVRWLQLTAHGRRHPAYGDPGAAARSSLLDRDVALTAAVLPANCYVPDLLTPKPAVEASNALRDQLDIVAETPDDVVVEQLHAHRRFGSLPAEVLAAAEAGEFARRAARGMWKFWQATLDDGWTRLRTALLKDIEARGRAMTSSGIGSVLDRLHPTLRWNGLRLEVSKPYDEQTALGLNDLVLAPTALDYPKLSVQLGDPADAVVYYPADRIGVTPGPSTLGSSPATDELIGSSRSRVLGHLAEPHSTTDLSERTGLSPATISHHLSVLMRSGLLDRQRAGRTVLYKRNDRADTLVSRGSELTHR